MGKKLGSGSGMKNPDHISESGSGILYGKNPDLGWKNFGSGIRYGKNLAPGSGYGKTSDPGSGINPQHCL
jgi:hypothetical protein